jgi:hypothetical protein
MSEFLEIEGEGNEDIASDSHRNADNGAFVDFWELNLGTTSC